MPIFNCSGVFIWSQTAEWVGVDDECRFEHRTGDPGLGYEMIWRGLWVNENRVGMDVQVAKLRNSSSPARIRHSGRVESQILWNA